MSFIQNKIKNILHSSEPKSWVDKYLPKEGKLKSGNMTFASEKARKTVYDYLKDNFAEDNEVRLAFKAFKSGAGYEELKGCDTFSIDFKDEEPIFPIERRSSKSNYSIGYSPESGSQDAPANAYTLNFYQNMSKAASKKIILDTLNNSQKKDISYSMNIHNPTKQEAIQLDHTSDVATINTISSQQTSHHLSEEINFILPDLWIATSGGGWNDANPRGTSGYVTYLGEEQGVTRFTLAKTLPPHPKEKTDSDLDIEIDLQETSYKSSALNDEGKEILKQAYANRGNKEGHVILQRQAGTGYLDVQQKNKSQTNLNDLGLGK